MSHTARKARKARKADRIPFAKAPKVGTPLKDRSFVTMPVQHRPGDLMPAGFRFSVVAPRSPRRVAEFLKNGGIQK